MGRTPPQISHWETLNGSWVPFVANPSGSLAVPFISVGGVAGLGYAAGILLYQQRVTTDEIASPDFCHHLFAAA
jgi:hypothetical protein